MYNRTDILKYYATPLDYEIILTGHLEELFSIVCEYYEEYCCPCDRIRELVHIYVNNIVNMCRGEQLCGKNSIH